MSEVLSLLTRYLILELKRTLQARSWLRLALRLFLGFLLFHRARDSNIVQPPVFSLQCAASGSFWSDLYCSSLQHLSKRKVSDFRTSFLSNPLFLFTVFFRGFASFISAPISSYCSHLLCGSEVLQVYHFILTRRCKMLQQSLTSSR